MKIMKAISEIKRKAELIQIHIDNRKDSNLTDLKVMELLGEKTGLNLALEILNENK